MNAVDQKHEAADQLRVAAIEAAQSARDVAAQLATSDLRVGDRIPVTSRLLGQVNAYRAAARREHEAAAALDATRREPQP